MFFDHLAIQVCNSRLETTVSWYEDFFACRKVWQQSTDFQDLTLQRLPGLTSIVELTSKNFRFHIFSREIEDIVRDNHLQFHHLGFSVNTSEEIDDIRDNWLRIHASNKYSYYSKTYVTEKIVDEIGVESIYFTDINGLEYELTYVPNECREVRIYPNAKT